MNQSRKIFFSDHLKASDKMIHSTFQINIEIQKTMEDSTENAPGSTFSEEDVNSNTKVSYKMRNGVLVSVNGDGLKSENNKLTTTQHLAINTNASSGTTDTSQGNQISNQPQNQIVDQPQNPAAIPESTKTMITTLPTRYDVTEFVGVLKTDGPSIKPVSDPLNFEHFKNYVKGKSCYNASILDQAKPSENRVAVAFEVDLWTLMETRSFKYYQRPYNGEKALGYPDGDPFDYPLPDSQHIRTDNYNPKPAEYPIERTQKKLSCEKCSSQGKLICPTCFGHKGQVIGGTTLPCTKCSASGYLQCKECNGSGYFLHWAVLVVKRKVLHSAGYYQNTFLPKDIIRKMPNKFTLFDEEKKWTNSIFITDFTHLCDIISQQCRLNFIKDLQQQYQDQHIIKIDGSTTIIQLRCSIRGIPVLEIDYELPDFINESKRNTGQSFIE